jgi:predicted Zn-dependent peptidase
MKRIIGLALLSGSACSAARPALPPAPPPRSASELVRWEKAPPLAPERDLQLDWNSRRVRLANGLGLTVISRPETQVTSLQLWLPSAADPSDGPVAVMTEALRAGTRTGTGTVLVNPRLAQESIGSYTEATGTTFTWRVLPRATQLALDLMADFVWHPVFDGEETRIRLRQELTSIQRSSTGRTHLANLARSALPGIEIPNPEQDARGLFKLGPKELKAVHRCAVSPEGAELVVVGPNEIERVVEWASASFAELTPDSEQADCAARGRSAAQKPLGTGRLDQIQFQIVYGGLFDPVMILVLPGPAPSSEDFVPFRLLAEVLQHRDAGSAQELRHMGATYGIQSRVNTSFPGLTLLELEGQLDPDQAQVALRRLIEDIRGVSETLTQPELDEVKRSWRNGFISSLVSNEGVASSALGQARRGRSPEALEGWPSELTQITLERCREVARRWLADAQPSVAVAGLPVKLVKGLGLGGRVRELYWTDELQEHKKGL